MCCQSLGFGAGCVDCRALEGSEVDGPYSQSGLGGERDLGRGLPHVPKPSLLPF
jgi:hypothetical protein